MNRFASTVLGSVVVCGMALTAHAQPFSLNWYTIDGGGGTSTGGTFSLSGTIGQHDAGAVMTGGTFALTGGFWSGAGGPSGPVCGDIDFNNDGIEQDPTDIEAFLSVYSGASCIPNTATCDGLDFNNDGIEQDPTDIEAFLSVYSGGPCF